MRKNKTYYSEKDSPFYRLKSKKKLAFLLNIEQNKLQTLSREDDPYHHFKKPKRSGGYRKISAPREDLKAVQKRIANLLGRIAPPDYLFAPVTGRSYIDNAASHFGAISFHFLDIEDFFSNCTANKVIWLFNKRLQCSPDVAAIIRGIVTRENSLPQGSPCSPLLAFLCYVDMWEEISCIARNSNLTLSVFADDITISGTSIPGSAIWEIKKTLRKHGHAHNKNKERGLHSRPVEITGIILKQDGLFVPNRLNKKLYKALQVFANGSVGNRPVGLEAEIRGREMQKKQIILANSELNAASLDTHLSDAL